MRISETEGDVLEEWRQRCVRHSQTFVEDGIVQESLFLKMNLPLVFVLKEANDPPTCDLKEFLRGGACGKTWNNVTRWAIGLQRLQEEVSWSDLQTIDQDMRARTLSSICVMNLKKWPGKGSTVMGELRCAVDRDSDLLRKQFRLYGNRYDVRIAVCCGVGVADGLAKALEIGDPSKWRKTATGVPFSEHDAGHYLVAFSHPQASIDAHARYNNLVNAYREILKR